MPSVHNARRGGRKGMRVAVHTVRPPPTPGSDPDVEPLTSWRGSSALGQGHTEA